nr:hypothetical protein B0A51_03164 [Rachicladosporium sp. CCFEE 5018]
MAESTSPSKLFSVEGMVVVITGGATGIGLKITKAFALNGAAKVYVLGRRQAKLDEAVELSPSNITPIICDVTDKSSLLAAAAQIKQETGHINLLCCNSGVMPDSIPVKASEVPVSEYAAAALQVSDGWDLAFATNSTSIALTSFAFLELLSAGNEKRNAPGRDSQILLTSSIAGYLRVPGSNMAYGASKAAATHMVKHLSGTLTPYSIRVNAIAPGLFESELANGLIGGLGVDGDPTREGSVSKGIIPAGRVGREGDVVGTVLYMASEAGSYLNGAINVIDGGRIGQLQGTY